MRWTILVVLLWGLVGGCSGRMPPAPPPPPASYTVDDYGYGVEEYDYEQDEAPAAEAPPPARAQSISFGGGKAKPKRESGRRSDTPGDAVAVVDAPQPSRPDPEPGEPPRPEPAAKRMVHYDGWARVRVGNPRSALEEVVSIAASVGGRVDRVSGNTATIRVPVSRFDEAWALVLATGDVMDRSVRADDITEAYTAIDLRARTLRETRKRLIELLGRAKTEEEKLRLLQQITIVGEELDAIESQLRTLSDLAAMSRISVEFVPREAFTHASGRPELAGMGWIRTLSPFRRSVYDDGKRVSLPVPEGLVALAPRGPYIAESPDGTVLWTMRIANDPVGSAAFWMDTIEDRLSGEFSEPSRRRQSGWECLQLREPGADEPYSWEICLRKVGNKLHVAQAFHPGPEQVERYATAIDQSLDAVGGGS